MQVSKIGFCGNLADAKVKGSTLIIGDEKYNRGDKVYIDFNDGQLKETGIITGFKRMSHNKDDKDFNSYSSANYVLMYRNLKNGQEKTTLPQVPFGYDIYNENELRDKILTKLDDVEELIAAKEQFYDRNLQGRRTPPSSCIVEASGKSLIRALKKLDVLNN